MNKKVNPLVVRLENILSGWLMIFIALSLALVQIMLSPLDDIRVVFFFLFFIIVCAEGGSMYIKNGLKMSVTDLAPEWKIDSYTLLFFRYKVLLNTLFFTVFSFGGLVTATVFYIRNFNSKEIKQSGILLVYILIYLFVRIIYWHLVGKTKNHTLSYLLHPVFWISILFIIVGIYATFVGIFSLILFPTFLGLIFFVSGMTVIVIFYKYRNIECKFEINNLIIYLPGNPLKFKTNKVVIPLSEIHEYRKISFVEYNSLQLSQEYQLGVMYKDVKSRINFLQNKIVFPKYYMSVHNNNNIVFLKGPNLLYLFSVDNPKSFIQEIDNRKSKNIPISS